MLISDLRNNMIRNRRILIVDDEPYNLLTLKIMLPLASFKEINELVDEALNGQEAVQKVKKAYQDGKFSYGLIIMDCNMPIMDGFEATDNIRHYIRKRKLLQPMIVACTGHTEDEFMQKAWHHQIDEFLHKPTNIESLRQILKELIEIKESEEDVVLPDPSTLNNII